MQRSLQRPNRMSLAALQPAPVGYPHAAPRSLGTTCAASGGGGATGSVQAAKRAASAHAATFRREGIAHHTQFRAAMRAGRLRRVAALEFNGDVHIAAPSA